MEPSHIMVKKGGYIYIYGSCEQFEGAHSLKLIDNEINYSIAYQVLHRLINNKRPIEVLRRHFIEIESRHLTHPVFNELN